jgi:hypothetical protein
MKIYFNSREKVDPDTLELAKKSGVVQKKPNGKWGIISLKSGEWWNANYLSRESAESALKAYHSGRFNNTKLDLLNKKSAIYSRLDQDNWKNLVTDYLSELGYKIPPINQDSFDAFYSYVVRHSDVYGKDIINALEFLVNPSGSNFDIHDLN